MPRASVHSAPGASATLECAIDGYPLPSVTWLRSSDQLALLDSDKYKIGHYRRPAHLAPPPAPVGADAGKTSGLLVVSQLNISHVDRHDYESYQCVAINSLANKDDASIRLKGKSVGPIGAPDRRVI